MGMPDNSTWALLGKKLVQSAEVTGSSPIVEHLYSATPKERTCSERKMSLGRRRLTPSSFSNALNASLMLMMALRGLIRAMPVIMILKIWIEEPDIQSIKAVEANALAGAYAIIFTCFCFAAISLSAVINAPLSSFSCCFLYVQNKKKWDFSCL